MAGILRYNRIKRRTSMKVTVYLGANMGDNPFVLLANKVFIAYSTWTSTIVKTLVERI